MTAPRPRRQRATRNDVSRYGKNQRRVWKDSVAAHQRLDYLCGALFANDIAKMAFALGVCKRYLNDIIRGHSRLTVRLAAHIAECASVQQFPELLQAHVFSQCENC